MQPARMPLFDDERLVPRGVLHGQAARRPVAHKPLAAGGQGQGLDKP
jgi:hypothetical protein